MTLKKYMSLLLKHDKECYRNFLRFLIYYDAYEEFSIKIATRGKYNWSYNYWSRHCANINLNPDVLIMNAFPWERDDRISWPYLHDIWHKQAPLRKLVKGDDN